MSDDETYYDALGAEPDASREQLRAAYRERIADLEAARGGKNVNETQLQQNRQETARVRAAWNVLSDPFQRKRYDEQIGASETNGSGSGGRGSGGDGEVELVDDESPGSEVQLSGWRKFLAPPPPKPKPSAGNGKTPPPRRPAREPTIPMPAGMRLAEPRVRGMALLFDFSVLLLLFLTVQLFVPGLVNSDFSHINDQISTLKDKRDKANTNADNASSKADAATAKAKAAEKNGDTTTADQQNAIATKQKQIEKDQRAIANKDDKQVTKLQKKLSGPVLVAMIVFAVASLLYLVPVTAKTGKTIGMRRRAIHVVRVDGSPVGWWASLARFAVPVLLTVALYPVLGQLSGLIGLGVVLWGYRDPNGQGIHDKLARTLVVADNR